MSAARAIARAEAAGLRLWVDAGAVRMEAAAPPPPDLLAELRVHRDDVVHLLAVRAAVSRGASTPSTRAKPTLDHDDAEQAAMVAHHAAPADPHAYHPSDPDPLRDGLRAAATKRPTAWADPAALPSLGAFCGCCDGRRWWSDPLGWRCMTCHPAPPELAFKEMRT